MVGLVVAIVSATVGVYTLLLQSRDFDAARNVILKAEEGATQYPDGRIDRWLRFSSIDAAVDLQKVTLKVKAPPRFISAGSLFADLLGPREYSSSSSNLQVPSFLTTYDSSCDSSRGVPAFDLLTLPEPATANKTVPVIVASWYTAKGEAFDDRSLYEASFETAINYYFGSIFQSKFNDGPRGLKERCRSTLKSFHFVRRLQRSEVDEQIIGAEASSR